MSSSALIILIVGIQALLIQGYIFANNWFMNRRLDEILENQETIINFINGTGQI